MLVIVNAGHSSLGMILWGNSVDQVEEKCQLVDTVFAIRMICIPIFLVVLYFFFMLCMLCCLPGTTRTPSTKDEIRWRALAEHAKDGTPDDPDDTEPLFLCCRRGSKGDSCKLGVAILMAALTLCLYGNALMVVN